MRRVGDAVRATVVASVGFVFALTGAVIAAPPALAAEVADVDTEAELNAAIQYAIDNPADPVVIDITGDFPITSGIVPLTAGSVTIAGNGHTISASSVSAAGFRVVNSSHLAIDALAMDFYESGPVVKSVGTPADPGSSPTVALSDLYASAGEFDVALEIADTAFSMTATTLHDSESAFAGDFSFGTVSLSDVTVLDMVSCGLELILSADVAFTADRITVERADCVALWIGASDSASATISAATLADNGAGIVAFNQGTGTIEVRDSTVIGTVDAEALFAYGVTGTIRLTNSTISGGLGDDFPTVSAIVDEGDIVISHSTITQNAASLAPVLEAEACGCGDTGSLILDHTILAANVGTGAGVPDLVVHPGVADTSTVTRSLIGVIDPADAETLALVEAPTADNLFDPTTAIDPQLGTLALNGGTTPNHLPEATSPVINAGNPAFAAPPATDQRAAARISGGIIDIGSVEVQFTPTLTLSRTTSASGEQVTATGSGYPAGTEFTMVLNSTPVTLGTATTTSGGALSFSFTVPTSVPAGAHTVTVNLAGNVVASASLTVTGLPDTGHDAGSALAFAGTVLLLVGLAMLALRRRSA